jgi:hypothetical protein
MPIELKQTNSQKRVERIELAEASWQSGVVEQTRG